MLIEGEQAYPIYKYEIQWIQNGNDKVLQKDLVDGRIYNNTSWYTMYKEDKNIEWLINERNRLVSEYFNQEKFIDKNILEIEKSVRFIEYETWCLTWFQHHTFDIGQSDEEVLSSFERFVERKERLILKNKDSYCLMGAEDRWRWRGKTDDGKKDTLPPCRCIHCKKRGIIRISH